jgi:hypothetical protein
MKELGENLTRGMSTTICSRIFCYHFRQSEIKILKLLSHILLLFYCSETWSLPLKKKYYENLRKQGDEKVTLLEVLGDKWELKRT